MWVWSGLVGGATSSELGGVALVIVGLANLALGATLVGGARMDCARTRGGG